MLNLKNSVFYADPSTRVDLAVDALVSNCQFRANVPLSGYVVDLL